MADMNFVDLIILAIFFISALVGLFRGLVSEVVSLVTLIAAFVIAILFAQPLASAFTHSAPVQDVVNQTSGAIGVSTSQPVSYLAIGISFAVLFGGTIIVGAIVKLLLNLAFQTGILGLGNRLFGAIFGLVRGFIINLVLIFLVQLSPFGSQPWWHQSQFVVAYQPAVAWLGGIVSPALANLKVKFEQTMQNVGSQIQNVGSQLNNYTQ